MPAHLVAAQTPGCVAVPVIGIFIDYKRSSGIQIVVGDLRSRCPGPIQLEIRYVAHLRSCRMHPRN
jgi:hypothetical protein